MERFCDGDVRSDRRCRRAGRYRWRGFQVETAGEVPPPKRQNESGAQAAPATARAAQTPSSAVTTVKPEETAAPAVKATAGVQAAGHDSRDRQPRCRRRRSPLLTQRRCRRRRPQDRLPGRKRPRAKERSKAAKGSGKRVAVKQASRVPRKTLRPRQDSSSGDRAGNRRPRLSAPRRRLSPGSPQTEKTSGRRSIN